MQIIYILGIIDSQIESIIANEETENDDRTWLDERLVYEQIEENPFQKWAQNIFEKSKQFVHEGNGINAMYLPSLIPILIKCMKLLPLWSGIMVSVFGYGPETASSAAVESSFKKLKTITFKSATLPVSIEEFLEQHISSLRGVSLIHSSQTGFGKTSENYEDVIIDTDNELQKESNFQVNQTNYSAEENDFLRIPDKLDCPLCSNGSLPSQNGAHKCVVCGIPVHALSTCSRNRSGDDNVRVCFSCWILEEDFTIGGQINENMNEERKAVESWNRKSHRKDKSYLVTNPHLRHLELNNGKNIKSLPLLKNGSRSTELKSAKSKLVEGKIVLTNTCAFDSLASLLMVNILILISCLYHLYITHFFYH